MEIWKESQFKKLSTAQDINDAYALSLNLFNNLGFEYCAFRTNLGIASHDTQFLDFNNYPTNGTINTQRNILSKLIQ